LLETTSGHEGVLRPHNHGSQTNQRTSYDMWLLTKPQILEENNLYTETTLKQEPEVLWFYKN
jgi:hypothetical protein